ncbi:MAG: DegT/DnrJ/EryC1/StrS family aminotransferase [Comamonadaceae bacterium]|nr:DegT/DnrJ/EryC1/StrS family aminotransferase [Comamonadaceae bacterium]
MKAFEQALSAYFGGRPVRAMNSGTGDAGGGAAPWPASGPGDEVITTPLTFVATANVIVRAGARAGVRGRGRRRRATSTSTAVEAAITPRTRALLPVHLAGCRWTATALYGIAQRHGLRVIEDAALSPSARAGGGRRIGSCGDLRLVQLPPQQEHDDRRGRLPRADRRRHEAAAVRAAALPRHRARLPTARAMDATVSGGKFNLTDVAARIGLGQLAAARRLQCAPRANWRGTTSSCFGRSTPRSRCGLPPARLRGQQLEHVPRSLLPLGRSRRSRASDFMRRHGSSAGIGVGVSLRGAAPVPRLPAPRLPRGAVSPRRAHRARDR